MLDLLKNIEQSLLTLLWAIAITLTVISVLTCLFLALRRALRNRARQQEVRTEARFETYLTARLAPNLKDSSAEVFAYSPREVPALLTVLLHYFRTLNGHTADRLRAITEALELEPHIAKHSRAGTLGRQMTALRTLSYLRTLSSLSVIHTRLTAKNKYVRLTAARCLTRREAYVYLPDIVHAISAAFPKDSAILTDILFRFGKPAIPVIESYVETSDNPVLRAACLETLIMLMPPKTGLNLDALMESPHAQLRASTVALSQITEHSAQTDCLIAGLTDTTTTVKIRSAKLALDAKRVDTLTQLYALTQDNNLWVRYWAMRGIYDCGAQGRKLVATIGTGDDKAAQMARDVALECASSLGAALAAPQSEAA